MYTIHWRLTSDRVRKYHAIQILDPKFEPLIPRLRAICGKPSPGPGWFTKPETQTETIPKFEICKTCLAKLEKSGKLHCIGTIGISEPTTKPTHSLYITNVDYVNKSITLDSFPLKESKP